MNRIYRLVFNRELGVVQVAPECARMHRGGARRAGRPVRIAGTGVGLLSAALLAGPLAAQTRVDYVEDTVVDAPVEWLDRDVRIGGDGDADVRVVGDGWLRATVAPGTPQLYWRGRIDVGGVFGSGTARLIVSGPDAGIEAFNAISVGLAGTSGQGTHGVLRIEDGAQASTITPDRRRGLFQVGLNGEATVTGAGSRLQTGEFAMGVVMGYGGGRMQVLDGGLLESDTANLWGNAPADRLPTVRVAGSGARWTNAGHLDLGGAVEVEEGGVVETGSIEIAGSFDTPHRVGLHIAGEGSRFESAAGILVREGSVTIADGATVSAADGIVLVGHTAPARPLASFLNIGGAIDSVGTNDVPTPGAAMAAGRLDPQTAVRFQANAGGNAQINFNHTDAAYTFGNAIVGVGAINSFAGTTILTGDLSAFAPIASGSTGRVGVRVAGGSTLVLRGDVNTSDANDDAVYGPEVSSYLIEDGTLVVGGHTGRNHAALGFGSSYSSRVEVQAGWLAGDGTVGTTRVRTGAGISPGDADSPLGTLDVIGRLLFDDGAVYAVDIAGDGRSDRIVVTADDPLGSTLPGLPGGAVIGAGVDVLVTALDPATSYQDGQRYTILSTDAAIEGSFARALTESAFLDVALEHLPREIGLRIGIRSEGPDDLVVEAGQTHTGTAPVGGVRVLAGGTLAPGGRGAFGTLAAGGDLLFADGAIYAVDIAGDGGSDRLTVAGKATLEGGTVEVTALDPATSYQNGQRYTILDAAGGVDGRFGTSASQSAFLTTTLDYATAGQVGLSIALLDDAGPEPEPEPEPGPEPGPGPVGPNPPPQVFQRVAQTANQYATAIALNGLPQQGQALALYNTLLLLDADGARQAFGHLSGEAHAGLRGQLLEDRFLRSGIGQRLEGRLAGTREAGATVWTGGGGLSQRTNGDGNASEVRTTRQGLQAGVDWSAERWLVGVAGGHDAQRMRMPALASHADVDGNHVGVYAATNIGPASLSGGVTYADYRVKMRREGAIGPRMGQSVESRYDASATAAFLQAGWAVSLGRLALTPSLTLAYRRLDTDAAVEIGDATALRIAERKDEHASATLGVRLRRPLSVGAVDNATLFGGIAWRHADGDLAPTGRHAFVVGGDAFAIDGAPLARNSGLVDVGVAVSTAPNARLSIAAQGQRGGGTSAFGAQLNWAWRF